MRNAHVEPDRIARRRLTALLFTGACVSSVQASNGLNMIGFGAESVLMAGADAAVARDTSALNTNPAGLAQIAAGRWDAFGAVARAIDVGHADAYGNDVQVSNKLIPLAGGGLASRWNDSIVLGFGAYAQGGAGARYDRLRTAFGTEDELSSTFGIAKLAAGASWQPTEHVRLGASFSAVVAQSRQRIFPRTSIADPAVPERSFFGFRVDGARAVRPGWRLGAQLQVAPGFNLGLVWSPRVNLPLTQGQMSVDFGAIGLGRVTYRNLKLQGLALPQEWSVGLAWQSQPATLWSAKVSHLAWSRALSVLTTEASDPDHPAAPPVLASRQTVVARDRTVLALGVHHRLTPDLAVLAGVNHMRRMLDDDSLNPTFAPLGTLHLTLGLQHSLRGGNVLGWGLEWLRPDRARYTNPQLPFGRDTEARNHYLALHLMLSQSW